MSTATVLRTFPDVTADWQENFAAIFGRPARVPDPASICSMTGLVAVPVGGSRAGSGSTPARPGC